MPIVIFEPSGRRIECKPGANLLEMCWEHHIPIESLCGGNGACGRCAVQVTEGDVPVTAEQRIHFDDDRLARGWRLACQTRVEHDLRVNAPAPAGTLKSHIVTNGEVFKVHLAPAVHKHFLKLNDATLHEPLSDSERIKRALHDGASLRFRPAPLRKLPETLRQGRGHVTVTVWDGAVLDVEAGDTSKSCYGIAFDVGTSTVVALLVDLTTGEELGVAAALNTQRKYGEDVISRISYCREHPDGVETLSGEIAGLLSDLAAQVTAARGMDLRHVYEYIAVGNTTMAHLIAGVDPSPLGELPYAPVFTARHTMLDGPKGARLGHRPFELPGAIGAYVGSDALTAVVAFELHTKPGMRLFYDIGTNAEILAGGRARMLATSAAAGPALEGVKIECGMIGVAGAIDTCTVRTGGRGDDGDLAFTTIGDVEPVGICGSGLVDVAAALLDLGVIDPSGRLRPPDACPDTVPPKIRARLHEVRGMTRIALAEDVYLSQRDVREFQNAKAAIAAGVDILLGHLGITPDQLDEVLIGGAFGSMLNPRSAQRTGVIPNVPLEKVRAVGNTAIQGAKAYLLSTDMRREICAARDHIELHELSTEPGFTDRFAEHMTFDAR
ncbi:MAG: DUF4445 domain-containing protein [Verrucomicrobia bacterium]|nr:DUF4445 domain-containing protein [Verrucomicrobiota bacterium]